MRPCHRAYALADHRHRTRITDHGHHHTVKTTSNGHHYTFVNHPSRNLTLAYTPTSTPIQVLILAGYATVESDGKTVAGKARRLLRG